MTTDEPIALGFGRNFAGEAAAASVPSNEWVGQLRLSSTGDRAGEPVRGRINLRAHEGAVMELSEEK
jgi:hypothetical protein